MVNMVCACVGYVVRKQEVMSMERACVRLLVMKLEVKSMKLVHFSCKL